MSKIQSIEDYIRKLNAALADLPKSDRENHIQEVTDHLMELVDSQNASETTVVNTFLPPTTLAKDILKEYDHIKKDNFVHPEYGFSVVMTCLIAPFGGLALPIIQGYYNAGVQFALLLQLIVGTILFFGYYRKRLTKRRLHTIKSMSLIMIALLSIPFALYSVSIIKYDEFIPFSTIYLGIYLLVWGIYYAGLYRVYKRGLASF